MASSARTTPSATEVAQTLPIVPASNPVGRSPFPPYVLSPGTQIPTYTNTPALPFLPNTPGAAAPRPQVAGQVGTPQMSVPNTPAPQANPISNMPLSAAMAATQGNYAASQPTQSGVVSAGQVGPTPNTMAVLGATAPQSTPAVVPNGIIQV